VLISGCISGNKPVHTGLGPASCTVATEPARRLSLSGGREVYLPPRVDAWSEGETFVAGVPAMIWDRRTVTVVDSVVGVVIGRQGRLRVVNAPMNVDAKAAVAVAAREGGGWHVFLTKHVDPVRRDTLGTIWYGVFDGRRWSPLVRVPMAPGFIPLDMGVSRLVVAGDTLAWAVRGADAVTRRRRTAVLRMHAGNSDWQFLPDHGGVYVALTHTRATGLQAAVVMPDPSERQDGNTLLLWTEHPTWNIQSRVSFEAADGAAHYPVFSGRENPVLTWYVEAGGRNEARALLIAGEGAGERTVIIDSDYVGWAPVGSVRLQNGLQVWVTHRQQAERGRELRISAAITGNAVALHTLTSPFIAEARVLWGGGQRIFVLGAVRDADSGISTALIRAQVNCTRVSRSAGRG
jgi:hypothetical protein